ncbi:MAG TPA: hypothetical protein VFQ76_16420 [Longimicrobiaceae bacterium]|nr:hypothetical protein [Longimicrobiaceae bacterium]
MAFKPLTKAEVLNALSFGKRVAEEEFAELGRYFVMTNQWQQLLADEIDVFYGHKGTGKSALYATLWQHRTELQAKNILLVKGENIRGAPAFRALLETPSLNEGRFQHLWKLFFLQLIGSTFREARFRSRKARDLISRLEDSGLLPREGGLGGLLRAALNYVTHFTRPEAVSGTIELDTATSLPSGVTAKISFKDPDLLNRDAEMASVDSLLMMAEEDLEAKNLNLWILLDRLDVAFHEYEEIEIAALRTLFRVYSDFLAFRRIGLKVFLRSDIWERITQEGFREASHITRATTIQWSRNPFLNMVLRRVLQSDVVVSHFGVAQDETLASIRDQEVLFHRIIEPELSIGGERANTFDWILRLTKDGTGRSTPREVIHLLAEARTIQIQKAAIGEDFPSGEALISGSSVLEALRSVSEFRLNQTLLSEYPVFRAVIGKLKGAPHHHSIDSLAELWQFPESWVSPRAEELVEVGFFERRGTREKPVYWIPFLYRPALDMRIDTAG